MNRSLIYKSVLSNTLLPLHIGNLVQCHPHQHCAEIKVLGLTKLSLLVVLHLKKVKKIYII